MIGATDPSQEDVMGARGGHMDEQLESIWATVGH